MASSRLFVRSVGRESSDHGPRGACLRAGALEDAGSCDRKGRNEQNRRSERNGRLVRAVSGGRVALRRCPGRRTRDTCRFAPEHAFLSCRQPCVRAPRARPKVERIRARTPRPDGMRPGRSSDRRPLPRLHAEGLAAHVRGDVGLRIHGCRGEVHGAQRLCFEKRGKSRFEGDCAPEEGRGRKEPRAKESRRGNHRDA